MNYLRVMVFGIFAWACLAAEPDASAKPAASEKPTTNDTSEINGLWHDQGGFGIWIANVTRSCAQGHTQVKPLLFMSPAAQTDQNAKPQTIDLRRHKMCLYFSEKGPLPEKCSSGTFTYRYEKASNQYVGEFSIQTSGGHQVNQHFRAAYCKPSN